MSALFHFAFYVPETHVEAVKTAIFAAGAGKVGHYDCCSWQTVGQGQFRPLLGAQPFIGSVDRVEKVIEIKVETVCHAEHIQAAVAALKLAHPYEEVAYMLLPMQSA
ncbi:MAG: NGG1p interacting factor NIF3 [Proteobacteria bacterium]|nr:NGG1p interacting factor NIF3 [Pseudomonadota bacterium]